MLRMTKLPKVFWGEAVRVASYLLKRSPSVSLGFYLIEKVWSSKDPCYYI